MKLSILRSNTTTIVARKNFKRQYPTYIFIYIITKKKNFLSFNKNLSNSILNGKSKSI